jgi:hypothetical protein
LTERRLTGLYRVKTGALPPESLLAEAIAYGDPQPQRRFVMNARTPKSMITRPAARRRSSGAVSVIAVAAALSAALLASSARARAEAPAGTYLGTLKGTDAFVAVLVGERGGMRAYVYDSTSRIASWSAPASARATRSEARASDASGLSVTSKEGFQLQATIANSHVSGSVRFPSGARHYFSAAWVNRPGSIYEIEIGRGATRYLGGWIIWRRGRTLGYLVPAPVVRLGHHDARARSSR